MKAIEIMFDQIDALNTQIKGSEDIDEKIILALKIGDISKIIGDLERHQRREYIKEIPFLSRPSKYQRNDDDYL